MRISKADLRPGGAGRKRQRTHRGTIGCGGQYGGGYDILVRCWARNDDEDDDDRGQGEALRDIPFELEGKVAGARAVAEASDIKSSTTA